MRTREVNHPLHAAVDDGDAHERRQKQRDGKRRKIADEPEYDRIANYESENLDYVVEEFDACVLIENLEFVA